MRFDALDRLMSVRRELAEERAAEEARWEAAEEAARLDREAEERRVAAEARVEAGPGAAADVRQQADGTPSDPGPPGRDRAVRPAPDTRAVPASMSGPGGRRGVADDQLEAIIARRAVND
jgi:hypothetical protein